MNKLVSIAKQKIGTREATGAHIALVNEYNSIRPLPHGYKLKTSDSWCAAFVSVCAKEAGLVDFPFECSVRRMYNKAKDAKRTSKTPKVGSLVVYDWGTNGTLDHIGIIESIDGDTLTVIEGNFANAVGRRKISTKSAVIYAYITTNAEDIPEDLTRVALAVIRGDYGAGNTRRVKLAAAGYDYRAVQAEVNRIYKSRKK